MDGLMVDTERQSDEGWTWACRQQGIEIPPGLLDRFKGATKESCRKAFDNYYQGRFDYEYTRMLKEQYIARIQSTEGVPPKPGLFVLLNDLREKHIPAVVATSTERKTAEKILHNIGAWDYLTDVAYGDEIKKSKPAPDIFLLAAKKAGAAPSCCIVLEDSINGIKSGAAAGCAVIHIPDTVQIPPAILQLTKAVVPTLAYVPELIEKWNQS